MPTIVPHMKAELILNTTPQPDSVVPQAYDEDLHLTAVGGENVQTVLAENLKEECSNSFSASVDWSTRFGHWQANLMGEGFYTDLSDIFVIESISPELQERRNVDGAEVYGGNFDFSLSGVYTGKMIVPHMQGYIEEHRMENAPDFFDFNAKVNYTFVLDDHVKLQLSAGVQNIFDKFQTDLDKGTYRDAGYFYGPTSPRTYIKLQFTTILQSESTKCLAI